MSAFDEPGSDAMDADWPKFKAFAAEKRFSIADAAKAWAGWQECRQSRMTSFQTAATRLPEVVSAGAQEVFEAPEPAMLDCEVNPSPLRYPLRDYHRAGFDGPLHFTWTDKPHRLLYDLIAAVRYYADRKLDDERRLRWMSEHEARICWNRKGDACRVFVRTDDEDDMRFEPVCGWDKFFDHPSSAIDAAIAAAEGDQS